MVSPRTPMTKRYRPSKSGKNSKAASSGYDSNVFNFQGDLVRRVMAMNGGAQQQESEYDDTTDGYDSHQVSTSAYDDSDEDDSEEDSSDDEIGEAELLAMLQALQAKKKAKKVEKSRQSKKRYASTTNDEDDFSDDNLSPSEMTEEQYFAYERRLAIKEEKLRAQKARVAESRARAAGSSRNATPSSSSLSLPSTKDKKETRNHVPISARREAVNGSTNISGWETPPGTPPSLLAPAKPPKMPSLTDKPLSRKKKGAEFGTAGVDVHHYPGPSMPGAPSSSKIGPSAAVSSTASKIERFERKTATSSTTKDAAERRKPSIDRKVPAGAARGGKKRE